MQQANFELQNEGSIVIIRPLDDATERAIRNITPDDAPWFGGLCVEPRYAGDVIEALDRGEGFDQ